MEACNPERRGSQRQLEESATPAEPMSVVQHCIYPARCWLADALILPQGASQIPMMQEPLPRLLHDAAFRGKYQTIKNRLIKKGNRPTVGDPQDNTFADTLDGSQYKQLMDLMLGMDTSAALRQKSLCSWLFASVGRADEGRMIFLSDMMAPRHINIIGGSTCPIELRCRML